MASHVKKWLIAYKETLDLFEQFKELPYENTTTEKTIGTLCIPFMYYPCCLWSCGARFIYSPCACTRYGMKYACGRNATTDYTDTCIKGAMIKVHAHKMLPRMPPLNTFHIEDLNYLDELLDRTEHIFKDTSCKYDKKNLYDLADILFEVVPYSMSDKIQEIRSALLISCV